MKYQDRRPSRLNQTAHSNFDLLAGGGEMRARMRRHDWSRSPLGMPDTWPSSLRTAVGIMLNSSYPMFLAWGPSLTFLFNDAYIPMLGNKQADALAQPFAQIWWDIWSDIGPLVDTALSGESIFADNLLLVMERNGFPEETYFTFSYSPVHDESGQVAGMFCACNETTLQILAERRQRFQLEMADKLRGLLQPGQITAVASALLGRHLDLTRVIYAQIDDDGRRLRVESDWNDGHVPGIAGKSYPIADLGPALAEEVRRGGPFWVADVENDSRTAAQARAYASVSARALLAVPLRKAGRVHSLLVLIHAAPRHWREGDVALAEDIAERIWSAVERAHAESSRRLAEAALSRQLVAEGDRLRGLFEQAPGFMAVLRGPKHVFELANKAFMRLIGPREILGKTMREALPELERQGFFSLLDQVYASGRPFSAHEALLTLQPKPDVPPTERFVDFIYQPVLEVDGSVSGIFIEGYDVTDRRLAAEAVRDSEERLREGLRVGRMVVWDWDLRTGGVTYSFNAMDVFGHAPDDAPEKWGAVHPDDMAQIGAAAQKAIDERSQYEGTVRMIRPDNGETIWVDVRGKVVCDAAGEPVLVRGISIDTTERKRAEDALRAADRRKDEFLAMLAHELRNPLAPISTAAQLLKLMQTDEPRIRKTSEIISRQVEHMTSLIDDLLDVSRVTRGLVTLEKETVALDQVVASTVEQVRPLIEARQHRLTVNIAPGMPPLVADRTRLVQVCTNLLNNAAKYTPPGGELLLEALVEDNAVLLRVRDNGIGIAPDLLPHMFDLFTQGERSPDRAQGGLGLGLALVKSLVELHGGSVSAYSAGPGQGSEFTLRLPLSAQQQEDAGRHEALQNAGATATPASRLMLVDDNVDAANTLAMLLELQGYAVSVEYRAHDALARAAREAPRVCLLDIGLPDMDGYELARRLRAQPSTADAILIALTGYGQAQDRERSELAGFDHHLVKPVEIGQLTALLARVSAPAQAA
jgi:PAS domain S-box-containing protein